MNAHLYNRAILLVISGGIAAYKALDLIRALKKEGAKVRCVLTAGGAHFITPLSVATLSEEPVATDLWSLTDNQGMTHLQLSRSSDLILVAPASANLLAKMAQGLADDLASTLLLANNKPVMVAPAMNVQMWENPATVTNVTVLKQRGVQFIGPANGLMACGEEGEGRMVDLSEIVNGVRQFFNAPGPLSGKRAVVTSGPTFEPIDPVRFIGNHSSGKQGHAIAIELQKKGAETTLITGPTYLQDPVGVKTIHVRTAREMLAAVEQTLPVDIAVCAAAVADWRPAEEVSEKIKKGSSTPSLHLVENPDILATLSKTSNHRPRLVVGFAAETHDVFHHAADKFARKGCDWLLVNEVGNGKGFDQDENQLTLLRCDSQGKTTYIPWPHQSKQAIAQQLAEEISHLFQAF